MKKSDMFMLAQYAVIRDDTLAPSEKVEILKALMSEENVAAWIETKEAEKEEDSAPAGTDTESKDKN